MKQIEKNKIKWAQSETEVFKKMYILESVYQPKSVKLLYQHLDVWFSQC